jgi:DNA-binding FadR family transcriptional regulator
VQILKGELPEGYIFPGEIEFSEQLGISRSALREACRVLGAKAGTRVSLRRHWSLLDPDLLAWQFEAEPTAQFLRNLFELRMVVEPAAAALAAVRRTETQVTEMTAALDVMARNGLATETGRLADQQFHAIMLEATCNDAIVALSSSIMAAIAWTTIFKQRKRALPRDAMPEHRQLLKAIAAGSAKRSQRAMA